MLVRSTNAEGAAGDARSPTPSLHHFFANGVGRQSSPTDTSVMLASVTGTTFPPRYRSASTSTFTVTLVVPARVVVV